MPRRILLLGTAMLVFLTPDAFAQACPDAKLKRSLTIVGGYVVLEVAVIALRHDEWWTTPSTEFHVDTKASPALQQDRLLHAWVGYQVSQLGALAWDWACFSPVAAGWLGAALGVAVQLPKEIGDGLHEGKGFDVADFAYSTAGAVLPALHRTWPATRSVLYKVNYWPSEEFRTSGDDLPQLSNDYAGMRFFLALNPGRMPGGAGWWPDWLGVAWGHSVDHWITAAPNHQWYFTTDLNFRGIPIKAKWWHSVATVLDQFHVPMPGIKLYQGEVTFGLF